MRKSIKMEVLYWLRFLFIIFLICIGPLLVGLFFFGQKIVGLSYLSGLILFLAYIFYRNNKEIE